MVEEEGTCPLAAWAALALVAWLALASDYTWGRNQWELTCWSSYFGFILFLF